MPHINIKDTTGYDHMAEYTDADFSSISSMSNGHSVALSDERKADLDGDTLTITSSTGKRVYLSYKKFCQKI